MESTNEFKRFYDLLSLLKAAATGKVEYEEKIARVLEEEYGTIYKEDDSSLFDLVNRVLCSLSSSVLAGYQMELQEFPERIPEGLEGTLLVLHNKTQINVEEFPKTYNDGIPLEYLKNIFLVELGDRMIPIPELAEQLRFSFQQNWDRFNTALESATEKSVNESFYLNRVNDLNNLQMISQTAEIIMLANYEEIPEMEQPIETNDTFLNTEFQMLENSLAGLEDYWRNPAAIEQIPMTVAGMEGFVCGVMSCYDIDPRRITGMEAGFVDSVKEGLRKTGETIMNMLRSIKDYFFGRKKDSIDQMEETRKSMKETLEQLKKEDASKYEINTENIGKMKKMLEDGDLGEEAGFFSSINSLGELITAVEKTLDKLEARRSASVSEAEKAIADADMKANEATKEPTGLKEDSSAEEKKLIKEQSAEKSKVAKEAVTEANEKTKVAFFPVRAATKIKSLFTQLFKKKEGGETQSTTETKPESVTGNEAWMD